MTQSESLAPPGSTQTEAKAPIGPGQIASNQSRSIPAEPKASLTLNRAIARTLVARVTSELTLRTGPTDPTGTTLVNGSMGQMASSLAVTSDAKQLNVSIGSKVPSGAYVANGSMRQVASSLIVTRYSRRAFVRIGLGLPLASNVVLESSSANRWSGSGRLSKIGDSRTAPSVQKFSFGLNARCRRGLACLQRLDWMLSSTSRTLPHELGAGVGHKNLHAIGWVTSLVLVIDLEARDLHTRRRHLASMVRAR